MPCFLLMAVSCEPSNNSSKLHPNPALTFHKNTRYEKITINNLKQWHQDYKLKIIDTVLIDLTDQKFKIESIADALIIKDEVLILDDGTTTIQSIGFDGSPNKMVARKGRGPGELTSPINMVKRDDGFVVMDRVNGIIYYEAAVGKNEPLSYYYFKCDF